MCDFSQLLALFTVNIYFHFNLKILEKYQVYGDSVLGKYGRRPNIRDVVKVGNKKWFNWVIP